jgi:hypothetical protein
MVSADTQRFAIYSVLWLAAMAVSVALIAVGAVNNYQWNDYHRHFDSTCTVEPRIPVYMMVAGALNVVYLVLRLILQAIH